ncbi:beta-1,6-N-acetylglucosaminyltransferase [Clostridium sp.]|uniref:beta-1,6-N-acetylglucosaminyltransferase n=1 Tax=Clostridium sp. TaxID=1506 RepID=UPI002608111C|nr:beta-1,6-N-acetylglucosaminyltransferase [Clostridium sp.]
MSSNKLLKHAYLIIAHNQFELLEKLILLLDDERNDIYIHIDKKVMDFNFENFLNMTKKSNVYFIDREDVNWGGYTLVNVEMMLLKAAIQYNYEYYHLISGVDLPIKTQDEIHSFFTKNKGKEFVHFDSLNLSSEEYNRVKYYYFVQDKISSKNPMKTFFRRLEILGVKLQKIININRIKDLNIKLGKGAQWFSITNNFAKYIIENETLIEDIFKYGNCVDEMFVQTILLNSKFKDNLYYKNFDNNYKSILRYIDWERGKPYIFKRSDYNQLMSSEHLFARKFDLNKDSEIINKIFVRLSGGE